MAPVPSGICTRASHLHPGPCNRQHQSCPMFRLCVRKLPFNPKGMLCSLLPHTPTCTHTRRTAPGDTEFPCMHRGHLLTRSIGSPRRSHHIVTRPGATATLLASWQDQGIPCSFPSASLSATWTLPVSHPPARSHNLITQLPTATSTSACPVSTIALTSFTSRHHRQFPYRPTHPHKHLVQTACMLHCHVRQPSKASSPPPICQAQPPSSPITPASQEPSAQPGVVPTYFGKNQTGKSTWRPGLST